MYKKKLITLLMIGVCFSGYAQKNIYSTKEEAAKVVAINKQTELLDKMQAQLKDHENKPKFSGSEIRVKKDSTQFLYEENKLADLLGFKIDNAGSIKTNNKGEKKEENKKKKADHGMKAVFSKLCVLNVNNGNPTTLIKEKIQLDPKGKIVFEYDSKKEKTDSSVLIVPISFETYTTANKNISNAKYKVTGKWHIKLVEDKMDVPAGTKKKDAPIGYKAKNVVLESFDVTLIAYLTSERETMKETAKRAIIEWYANLPHTLDKQYAEQAVTDIKAMNVSANDIVMSLPESQNLTVTQVPTIIVNIDPYQFINNNDRLLYTEPKAHMIIAPVFNISIDDTFKKANISVSYVEKECVKPITDGAKVERSIAANAVVANLATQLSAYVTSHDAAQKTAILDMFEAADNDVKVSHRAKNGKEKIESRTAEKYLNRLKGTNLTFANIELINENMVNELNAEYPELGLVFDSNLYTVMYLINQKYESKTYKDSTDKIVFLNYNNETKGYRINKIEVVPNSTNVE